MCAIACLRGICIKVFLSKSEMLRASPRGSGTIIISSPDSCIYPPIIPPTCPCLTATKVSPKSISLGSHLAKEVVQKFALTAGRKPGWNTVANKLVATNGYWWLPGSGTELSV